MAKRILIFSTSYFPLIGGAEIAVKEITDRIGDARLNDTVGQVEFDMVTMQFEPSHAMVEKVGNVKVYRIKASKITFPIEAFLFAKTLHQTRNYDAIWAIMAARAGGAALFFKYNFPQVPFILTLQEGDPVWYMKLRSLYYVNTFFRKIFSNADKVQAISNYLADYAHTMGHKGKVEVIPNGVDVKKFSSVKHRVFNKDEIKLITTSRLVEKNGVGDIIESLVYLPRNIHLEILGVGPLEKSLRKRAKDLNLNDRVHFLGHVSNEHLPEYLARADIFVRPSLSEGFGISFIEAMASGLPVIATPVGGIVDFLFDPEQSPGNPPTGLFAEVGNPESIARQVNKLITNKLLRETIIENAQKMVEEKYDWNLIAANMKSEVFDAI